MRSSESPDYPGARNFGSDASEHLRPTIMAARRTDERIERQYPDHVSDSDLPRTYVPALTIPIIVFLVVAAVSLFTIRMLFVWLL